MNRLPLAAILLAGLASIAGVSGARADEPGEAVFKKNCSVCHSTEAGKNKIGPSLAGVVGRKAGSAPNYNYSDANKNSGVTWDEATLEKYLVDPRKFIPGTKMVFVGLKNPDDRKAVISFLEKQK